MHVDPDLSAYLDGELTAADRARVEDHLRSCDRCSARLAELRATASLIAALPSARPSRSLVPALTPRWNWLRPFRSVSAIASGAFLFVFLLTAIGRSGTGLGGGDETTAFLTTGANSAQAAATAAATAASSAAPRAAPAAQATAAPPIAAPVPQTSGPAFGAIASVAPADAAQKAAPAESARLSRSGGGPLTEPLFWLGLAVIAAIIAIAAHVRLRGT